MERFRAEILHGHKGAAVEVAVEPLKVPTARRRTPARTVRRRSSRRAR